MNNLNTSFSSFIKGSVSLVIGVISCGFVFALTIPSKNANHETVLTETTINQESSETMSNFQDSLNLSRGFVNGDLTTKGENNNATMDVSTAQESTILGGYAQTIKNTTGNFIVGGRQNQIEKGNDKYIIGGNYNKSYGDSGEMYIIGGHFTNQATSQTKGNNALSLGGENSSNFGENTITLNLHPNISSNGYSGSLATSTSGVVTVKDSIVIGKVNATANQSSSKNLFYYSNTDQKDVNTQSSHSAVIWSENGVKINTDTTHSGVVLNLDNALQIVPQSGNLSNLTKVCNATYNGTYEVVYSPKKQGFSCWFYCNGKEWSLVSSAIPEYCTGITINTSTNGKSCKIPGEDTVIYDGMKVSLCINGNTPITTTCKNGTFLGIPANTPVSHTCTPAEQARCENTNHYNLEHTVPCGETVFSSSLGKNGPIAIPTPVNHCPANGGTTDCKFACTTGYHVQNNECQINKYYIHYDANQGTGIMNNTECLFDTNCALRTNSFLRDGYIFRGWSLTPNGQLFAVDGNVTNLTTESEGTVTLYALWNPITYIISYQSDGSGTMANTSCTYDTNCTLSLNTFTKQPYTFYRWLSSKGFLYENGATVRNLSTKSGDHITLYTTRSVPSSLLTLDLKGGYGVNTSIPIVYGFDFKTFYQNVSFLPSRANSHFEGFYTGQLQYFDQNGKVIDNLIDDFIYARVDHLVAKWTCNPGYYSNANGTACELCPAGYYCPGGSKDKQLCPTGYSQSNSGSTENTACQKTLTATFNGNGASVTPAKKTCQISYPQNRCIISTAQITRTGFEILGWNTNASAHIGTIAEASQINLTENATFYAITKKTVTSFITQGTGVFSINNTTPVCDIWNTATTCNLAKPGITCQSGYNNPIFSNNTFTNLSNDLYTTGSCTRCANGTYTNGNTCSACKEPTSGFGAWTSNGTTESNCQFTCQAGFYKNGSNCVQCEVGTYCPGDNNKYNCPCGSYCQTGAIQPISCGDHQWSNSNVGSCYTATTGYYASGSCEALACGPLPDHAKWISNGTNNDCKWACIDDTYAISNGQCIKTQCKLGQYFDNQSLSCKTCTKDSYCDGGAPIPCQDGYHTESTGATGQNACFKVLTATFDANNATSIGFNSNTCNLRQGTSTCNIQTPSITRPGYNVIGWNTNREATTGTVAGGIVKIATDTTYYAITAKNTTCKIGEYFDSTAQTCKTCEKNFYCPDGKTKIACQTGYQTESSGATGQNACFKTLTATFNLNGAMQIGATSLTCKLPQGNTTCSITTPTITRPGFDIIGWNSNSGATTGTVAGSSLNISTNSTYYAITTKTVTSTFNKGNGIYKFNGSTSNTSTTKTCTIANTSEKCSIDSPSITCSTGYYAPTWTKLPIQLTANITTTGKCERCPSGTYSSDNNTLTTCNKAANNICTEEMYEPLKSENLIIIPHGEIADWEECTTPCENGKRGTRTCTTGHGIICDEGYIEDEETMQCLEPQEPKAKCYPYTDSLLDAPTSNFCTLGEKINFQSYDTEFTRDCKKDSFTQTGCSAQRHYLLTFDAQGGTGLSTSSFKIYYGKKYPYDQLPKPTKTGYDFLGRFKTGSSVSIKSGDIIDVAENLILYAHRGQAKCGDTIGKCDIGTPCSGSAENKWVCVSSQGNGNVTCTMPNDRDISVFSVFTYEPWTSNMWDKTLTNGLSGCNFQASENDYYYKKIITTGDCDEWKDYMGQGAPYGGTVGGQTGLYTSCVQFVHSGTPMAIKGACLPNTKTPTKTVGGTCHGKINCTAGQYVKKDTSTCSTCPAGYYCAGGAFTKNRTDRNQGNTQCLTPYTSSKAGASSIEECYVTVPEDSELLSSNGSVKPCSTGKFSPSHVLYYGEISADKGDGYYSCHAKVSDIDRRSARKKENKGWRISCSDNTSFFLGWTEYNAGDAFHKRRPEIDDWVGCFAGDGNIKIWNYRLYSRKQNGETPICNLCIGENCPATKCVGEII